MILVHDGYRFCVDCRRALAATRRNFYVHDHSANGRSQWDSYCRPCRRRRSAQRIVKLRATKQGRAKLREYDRRARRRQRRAHPESVHEANAREWQRVKDDPERHWQWCQDRRIDAVLRAGRESTRLLPKATGAYRKYATKAETLDARPFVAWLRTYFVGQEVGEVSAVVGIGTRYVRALLDGRQTTITVKVADAAFVRARQPHLLFVLYPLT